MDQSTLVWILRIVSFFAALLVARAAWSLMRRKRMVKKPEIHPAYPKAPQTLPLPSKRIVLQLMKKPSYVLDYPLFFKVMEDLEFEFSDNEIFGYFEDDELLFRVVNVHAPYRFSKGVKNTRSTNGVKMVLDLPLGNGENQEKYFQKLLVMAQEISEVIDASICNEYRRSLKESDFYQIQKEIEQFEQQYQLALQNDYQLKQ